MMALAWGARAGAVSFAPVLSMIFSMAVPPSEHELSIAGWSACGGFAYVAWALVASVILQRRYRTLAVASALRAAAQLFRSRADVLVSYRVLAGEAPPLGPGSAAKRRSPTACRPRATSSIRRRTAPPGSATSRSCCA